MRMKRLAIAALAMSLTSISMLSSCDNTNSGDNNETASTTAAQITSAAAEDNNEPSKAEAADTQSGSENLSFDQETGVLTLKGNITKEEIDTFRDNALVKSIVAEEGCILPEDCSQLFVGANNSGVFWKNVTSIDLSKADSSEVTNMEFMFSGCYNTEVIDLSGFDTSKVTNMRYMFSNCLHLKTIYASENWTTINVTDSKKSHAVFEMCYSLIGGCGTKNYCDIVDKTYACIDAPEHQGFLTLSGSEPAVTVTNLSEHAIPDEETGILTLTGEVTREEILRYRNYYNIESVVAADDCVLPEDCSNLFGIYAGDEEYNDRTGNGCWLSVDTIDLSKADASKVVNMSNMFGASYYLNTLDVSGWDTSNVTDMSDTFSACQGIKKLDLSGWDTSNVTNMYEMFDGCSSLETLDITGMDTSKVTDMTRMFSGCVELKELDVSSFDTSNVTTMELMFASCYDLTSIDVSSFDTSNVTNMRGMFEAGFGLETIYASDKFTTEKVEHKDGDIFDPAVLFAGLEGIKGGNGTTFDYDHIDTEYARIDTPETPGYFTLKE